MHNQNFDVITIVVTLYCNSQLVFKVRNVPCISTIERRTTLSLASTFVWRSVSDEHYSCGLLFQEELVYVLRKLLYHIADLPAQTAHTLFNYLVGVALTG